MATIFARTLGSDPKFWLYGTFAMVLSLARALENSITLMHLSTSTASLKGQKSPFFLKRARRFPTERT